MGIAQPTLRIAARPILTRRHHGLLSAGFVAFVIYGSLVPFHYQPLSFEEAIDRFREVCSRPIAVESRSDWLANIALFMPLGYLLMGSLAVDRRRLFGLAALIVLPFCAALSAAVEFAQLAFPPRVSSLNDVAAESLGGLIGVIGWLVFGQRITAWARRVWMTLGTHGLAARLLPGYLFCLVVLHALPFDLTISPKAVWHKYRDGQVRLLPFAGHDEGAFEAVQNALWDVALFLPLGLLLALIPALRNSRRWPRVVAAGLAATILMQGVKLFVVSRFSDAADVVTGTLAVVAGWGVMLLYHRRHTAATSRIDFPRTRPTGLRLALLAVWLSAVVFINWQPFDFRLDDGWAADRLRELSWLPFKDYYGGNYWNALDQFLHKTLLFLPLGALLAQWLPADRSAFFLVLVAAIAAVIEIGQSFLPTRYPSVTDVLVESGGAWLGFALAGHARILFAVTREPNNLRDHREFCR